MGDTPPDENNVTVSKIPVDAPTENTDEQSASELTTVFPETEGTSATNTPTSLQSAYPALDSEEQTTQAANISDTQTEPTEIVQPELAEMTPPQPVVAPVVSSEDPNQSARPGAEKAPDSSAGPSRKRKLVKTLIVAIVAVAVLGGGSAAAYFGVVVPNKPENVLLASVANGLQQTEGGFSGTINADPLESSGTGVKMTFDGAGNLTKKAAKLNTKFVVSGIDISAEMRYVDKNLYIKMGDLTTATSLLNSYSPLYGSMVQSVVGQIANKWIVIDSTLINKASNTCALDADMTLTDQDMDTLLKQYKAHPFTTISSVSDDTVDGKKVQKYVLSLDDDKMAVFAASIKDITPIKNLLKCDKNSSWDPKTIADHDKTPLTLWIDKSNKQIVQLSSHSTAQDEKTMDYHMSATVKFDQKSVSVTAPDSSTPIMQVLGNLGNGLNDQTSATDFSSI